MKKWTPVSLEAIEKMMKYLPSLLNQEQLGLWNFIRLTPQKWQEDTMGKEGGGFWVVGLFGNKALDRFETIVRQTPLYGDTAHHRFQCLN